MATLLIADDEKNILSGLRLAFEDEGYQVITAADGNEAWDKLQKNLVDLVITDLRMPGMDGYELLKRISSSYPMLPVIVLTGHGTIETAVETMRDGAVDFFTKPVDIDKLALVVKKSITASELKEQNRKLSEELARLRREKGYTRIIGRSQKVSAMMQLIEQVADTRATVLVTGESGTGKELVADALVALSSRSDKPFVKVHAAALSASLLEDELFGHEKGAFTGATGLKKGRFELADGGTIFLDEIGEIDLSTQVKLLRVLQEREFERVGGEKPIAVDVRVICATNRNLEEEVKKGNFREDLYYRLNVVRIEVPSLRERKEDINLLAASFLETFNKEDKRKIEGFTPAAAKALMSYSWPGNIRELKNAIESAVVLCKGKYIDKDDLPQQVRESGNGSRISFELPITLDEAEKRLILETISFAKGNKTKAAELLGIGRKTITRRMQDLKIGEEEK
ncbi:MAG: sigma-54-dependent Fis family transcriptional regulator [Spirochaetes bacterium]|uniref:Sigma-54-dependent Fis family transcriptional regulator n=1 Tax=Candidatus Ornithospirochaeta stercoripullorum TaxID=2840899 RepID=A0A9D9E302_9SPIO|nr:sigma-54-dependent Fis family transcriptional regulator [Candidatus Ornithospirochaeta stercoripullorum]